MVVQLQSHSEEEMIASALDNVSFTIANVILTLTLGLTSQTAWPLGHMCMKNLSTDKSGLGFYSLSHHRISSPFSSAGVRQRLVDSRRVRKALGSLCPSVQRTVSWIREGVEMNKYKTFQCYGLFWSCHQERHHFDFKGILCVSSIHKHTL